MHGLAFSPCRNFFPNEIFLQKLAAGIACSFYRGVVFDSIFLVAFLVYASQLILEPRGRCHDFPVRV